MKKEAKKNEWIFSDEELDKVLKTLQENQSMAQALLNSANEGNSDDIQVLMELSARRGYMLTVDKFKQKG